MEAVRIYHTPNSSPMGEWNAMIETEHGGCLLWHKDINPPDISMLAFAAHRDEIIAAMQANDRQGVLFKLVLDSMFRMEVELKDDLEEARKQ